MRRSRQWDEAEQLLITHPAPSGMLRPDYLTRKNHTQEPAIQTVGRLSGAEGIGKVRILAKIGEMLDAWGRVRLRGGESVPHTVNGIWRRQRREIDPRPGTVERGESWAGWMEWAGCS